MENSGCDRTPSRQELHLLRCLYREYLNLSDFRRRMAGEGCVMFDIGYIDGCYYTEDELRRLLKGLKDRGLIGDAYFPSRDVGFTSFTEQGKALGAELCEGHN